MQTAQTISDALINGLNQAFADYCIVMSVGCWLWLLCYQIRMIREERICPPVEKAESEHAGTPDQ